MISACEKSKQLEQALKIFDDMQKKGVVPDLITYSALISAFETDHPLLIRAQTQQDFSMSCKRRTNDCAGLAWPRCQWILGVSLRNFIGNGFMQFACSSVAHLSVDARGSSQ